MTLLISYLSPFWSLLYDGKSSRAKLTSLRQEAIPVSCKSYPHIFLTKSTYATKSHTVFLSIDYKPFLCQITVYTSVHTNRCIQ